MSLFGVGVEYIGIHGLSGLWVMRWLKKSASKGLLKYQLQIVQEAITCRLHGNINNFIPLNVLTLSDIVRSSTSDTLYRWLWISQEIHLYLVYIFSLETNVWMPTIIQLIYNGDRCWRHIHLLYKKKENVDIDRGNIECRITALKSRVYPTG